MPLGALVDLVADQALPRTRNVIVTPHSASKTREAVQRIAEAAVENIRVFADGRSQNLVAAPVAATPSSKE